MHNWPERVLTRKMKRQAKERVPRFRLACLLFCQNRMVIQTYLGGQKKKKVIFLDSNQAHLLRADEADVGEHQAGSSRDTGVPQSMNATKSPSRGI